MLGTGSRGAPIVKVTWQVCDSTSSSVIQQNAYIFNLFAIDVICIYIYIYLFQNFVTSMGASTWKCCCTFQFDG